MPNNVFSPLYAAGFNYYLRESEDRNKMWLVVHRSGTSVEREVPKDVLITFSSDNEALASILREMMDEWRIVAQVKGCAANG